MATVEDSLSQRVACPDCCARDNGGSARANTRTITKGFTFMTEPLMTMAHGSRRYPISDRGHHPAHDRGNLTYLRYEFNELVGIERLHAVGQSFVGIAVDFNNQSIRAHRHCRP